MPDVGWSESWMSDVRWVWYGKGFDEERLMWDVRCGLWDVRCGMGLMLDVRCGLWDSFIMGWFRCALIGEDWMSYVECELWDGICMDLIQIGCREWNSRLEVQHKFGIHYLGFVFEPIWVWNTWPLWFARLFDVQCSMLDVCLDVCLDDRCSMCDVRYSMFGWSAWMECKYGVKDGIHVWRFKAKCVGLHDLGHIYVQSFEPN